MAKSPGAGIPTAGSGGDGPSGAGNEASANASLVPETSAGAQFSRWLKAFNSGDRGVLLAYHEEHFPYSAATRDVESIERELGLSRATGGFEPRRIDESSATLLSILLQERRGQFAHVELEVDAEPPHRVVRFQIGPVPTPKEFLTSSELEVRRLDAGQRRSAIETLARDLDQHYVSAPLAREMKLLLDGNLARGTYATIYDATELAEVLTTDLRAVCHDKHLSVRFGQAPPPAPPPVVGDDVPSWISDQNYGFGPIERLAGNVALLTINGFIPLLNDSVKAGIGARMQKIADAEAAIVDLRGNGGGVPSTVAFIASYFFDASLLLNKIVRRDTGAVNELWTEENLPGARFGAGKPVYVLTSARTFSGGEDLAYTLQAHQRARVIGEVTGGGAHPVEPRALGPNLYVNLPWGESINPVTGTNWERIGVQPNVAVTADAAQEKALELVRLSLESQNKR
jgi:hypothetical protein